MTTKGNDDGNGVFTTRNARNARTATAATTTTTTTTTELCLWGSYRMLETLPLEPTQADALGYTGTATTRRFGLWGLYGKDGRGVVAAFFGFVACFLALVLRDPVKQHFVGGPPIMLRIGGVPAVAKYMTGDLCAGWITAGIGCLAVVSIAALPAGAITFVPHYTDAAGYGFYDPVYGAERQRAFEFALQLWSSRILDAGGDTIDVSANFEAMGGTRATAVLGAGGPSSFVTGFTGSRVDTAYPDALADYMTGSDLNAGQPAIEISFNSDIDGPALGGHSWYYGLDANPPNGDPDFVSVAMHEMAHSMGFISTFTASGVYGLDMGAYGTVPAVFDRYLVNSTGANLVNLKCSPANVTQPVYWGGVLGTQEYKLHGWRGQPPMYAPTPFSDNSSLSHLDESTFVGEYDMMTPYLSHPAHVPDDVVRGMMADIGWQSAGVGDTNLDGRVDVLDLLAMVNRLGKSYGQEGYLITADANGDGVIDMQDLTLTAGLFGQMGVLGSKPDANSMVAGAEYSVWNGASCRTDVYAAVPEPGIWLMLVMGLGGVLRRGGRNGKS